MYQRCGLQCLPRFLLHPLLCSRFAQLVVDQWQQLLRGLRTALVDGVQNSRDFVHAAVPSVGCYDGSHYSGTKSILPEAPIDGPGRVPESLGSQRKSETRRQVAFGTPSQTVPKTVHFRRVGSLRGWTWRAVLTSLGDGPETEGQHHPSPTVKEHFDADE
jgi:hypothetical protein